MDGPHHFARFYHEANCNVTNSQYHFSTFYHYSSCNVTNSQHHFAVCNALCTTRPTAILPRADATLQRSTTRTTAVTKSQCHFITFYHEDNCDVTKRQCQRGQLADATLSPPTTMPAFTQVVNRKRRHRDPFESEFHPRRAKTRSGGD